MATELTCSNPQVHMHPKPSPTRPGENRAPGGGCLDSGKHVGSLFRVYMPLTPPHPGDSGWDGKGQTISHSAGNQGSERVSHMPRVTQYCQTLCPHHPVHSPGCLHQGSDSQSLSHPTQAACMHRGHQ